jgi:hypothetical protein
MKKTLTVVALLAGAASGYSQGLITFNNFVTGFHQPIYNVSTATTTSVTYGGYTTFEEQGSAANATPAGTSVYSGAALGGSAATSTQFDMELLAAPGTGDALSALVPVGTVVNFSTAPAGAGYAKSGQNIEVNQTGTAATIAIAAWNNGGGLYNTLAAAQAAGEPWGISPLANISGVVAPSTPAAMSTASDLNLSFSLGSVPEPS